MVSMKSSAPTLIVLGAGRGSRFAGTGHKLAQRVQGMSVFARTVANALSTGLPVKVVTTEPLAPLVNALVATRDIVLLPEADAAPDMGMGTSISSGVMSAAQSAGWLVLPADMPFVRPQTLISVAAALPGPPVVYAQHAGRRGHPVGFGAELYSELVALRGDEGARRVVARYPALAVDVDDPGVLQDLDTLDDFQSVRSPRVTAQA